MRLAIRRLRLLELWIPCILLATCLIPQARSFQPWRPRYSKSGPYSVSLYQSTSSFLLEEISPSWMIPAECSPWIDEVALDKLDDDLRSRTTVMVYVERLSESKGGNLGFCNSLFLVQAQTTTNEMTTTSTMSIPVGILKVYSELAQARMQVSTLDPIDQQLGELHLGPKVWGSSKAALLMEYYEDGIALTEDLVHSPMNSHNQRILSRVAQSLSRLHRLDLARKTLIPAPSNHQNMLWDSIDVLLERIMDPSSRSFFQTQVEFQRCQLERLGLPMVHVGHGDFKPSNVLWLQKSQEIRFIDLETVGSYYRAYDLAKFFRTRSVTNATTINQEYFLGCYLEDMFHSKDMVDLPQSSITLLFLESQLLIPMTWLEAAIFFHASRQPSTEWKLMAEDRFYHYQQANAAFLSTVEQYQMTRQNFVSIRSNSSIAL